MKHRLGTVSRYILQEGLNQCHSAPTLPLVQCGSRHIDVWFA